MEDNDLEKLVSWVQPDELAAEVKERAELGDKRLDRRLGALAVMMTRQPDQDFPENTESEKELEAAYRFVRNDKATFQTVAEPHFQGTAKRVDAYRGGDVLAIHDCSSFVVSDETYVEGMGRGTSNSNCGFHGQFCLAVPAEGPRYPFGLLGGMLWRRGLPSRMNTEAFEESKDCLETLDNESVKWDRTLRQVDERLGDTTNIIHVMDAEADNYRRFAELEDKGGKFISRLQNNRRVEESIQEIERPKVQDCLEHRSTKVGHRTIEISSRDNQQAPPATRQEHPSRQKREAVVEIRAAEAQIQSPNDADENLPETLELGVIWVRELDPPEGAEPIDWKLLTNLDITESPTARSVVDYYRRRWVIEEYFGALKGGCNAEDRLLRSAKTYTTTLGILLPAAWRLLAMRSLAHAELHIEARAVLRDSQLEALATFDQTDFEDIEGVTVPEAFEAIAQLGGHLSRNGAPGWEVLMRGWLQMIPAEIAHIETRQQTRQDVLDEIRHKRQTLSAEAFEQWLEEQTIHG